jgi:lipoprotein
MVLRLFAPSSGRSRGRGGGLFWATAACGRNAKYAKLCRGGPLLILRFFAVTAQNMLNFASKRQPLAARIDKISASGARRNFTAELWE